MVNKDNQGLNRTIKYGLFLFAIFSFSCLISCKKKEEEKPQATACFSVSPRFMTAEGQSSQFSNCSRDFDRSEWNFGDGQSSTLQDPSHKWEDKGVFDVSLNVFGEGGNGKTSQKVYVGQKGHILLTVSLTNWKTGPDVNGFSWDANVHTEDSFNSFLSSFKSTRYDNLIDVPAVSSGDIIVNHDVPVYVELSVRAGTLTAQTKIEGLNIIDGAKNPTGSAVLSTCDLSYTVSTNISQ